MAEKDTQRKIIDIVLKYAEVIGKEKQIDKVILYGSRVRDNGNIDSDVDVAVISPDFTGDRMEDQFWLMKQRREIDLRIEPMPFRPEDFIPEDPFVREIIETGVDVY